MEDPLAWNPGVPHLHIRLYNGDTETFTGIIQIVKRRSRGLRTAEYFVAMNYPWRPN